MAFISRGEMSNLIKLKLYFLLSNCSKTRLNMFYSQEMIQTFVYTVYIHSRRCVAHLREEDAERVGVVLPGYVDLWLRVPTFPLDFCATGQSERRLLRDQLHKDTTSVWKKGKSRLMGVDYNAGRSFPFLRTNVQVCA